MREARDISTGDTMQSFRKQLTSIQDHYPATLMNLSSLSNLDRFIGLAVVVVPDGR
jgi:hypothetical protein